MDFTYTADGTAYRLVFAPNPSGGWIVIWPDVGWTGLIYRKEIDPFLVPDLDRTWGFKISKLDRDNIRNAAYHALRKKVA
jgi:hypothetical protein